jgi:glycosyltransferase involved in cell wall biosynthesis
MEKIKVNAEFVCLNYQPYEGWGRHRDMILDKLEFLRNSPNKVVLANPYPLEIKKGERLIFLSTYEADKIPESWVRPANDSTGLIVPDPWVKEVFKNSGVTVPISVVSEGVSNNEIYYPSPYPFTFLHFDATSENNRKGGDLVTEAFVQVFGNMQNKVKLIMKGRNHQVPLVHRYSNIEYIFENYSEKEMERLWERTNCFVFPSRGEGFGLPPLEAMAHGIPTILTDGSAMHTFAHYGIPLRVSGKTPAIYDRMGAIGMWDKPDIGHLAELMKRVYDDYVAEKERAIKNSVEVWQTYNFENVAPFLAESITKMFENAQREENDH